MYLSIQMYVLFISLILMICMIVILINIPNPEWTFNMNTVESTSFRFWNYKILFKLQIWQSVRDYFSFVKKGISIGKHAIWAIIKLNMYFDWEIISKMWTLRLPGHENMTRQNLDRNCNCTDCLTHVLNWQYLSPAWEWKTQQFFSTKKIHAISKKLKSIQKSVTEYLKGDRSLLWSN